MSEKGMLLVERFWPIIGGVALVIGSFATVGATASRAEAKADKITDTVNGDSGVRERLTRIEAKLDALILAGK